MNQALRRPVPQNGVASQDPAVSGPIAPAGGGEATDQPPSWLRLASTALWLAPLWGLLMALSVCGTLILHGRFDPHLPAILLLYGAGGLIAFPFSILAAEFTLRLRRARRSDTRFAAHFLCLTLLTIAATALLFALQYRLFFAQWHGTRFSYGWTLHFLFTTASAVYQFIAIGIRLYLPFGLPMLLGMSLYLARRRGRVTGPFHAASD